MSVQYIKCQGVNWPNSIAFTGGYSVLPEPMVHSAERSENTARLIMEYKGIVLYRISIKYPKLTAVEFRAIYETVKAFTNLEVEFWEYRQQKYMKGIFYAPTLVDGELSGFYPNEHYNNVEIELIPVEEPTLL